MKVILLTTLLLFSINGFAFNWKKVVESKSGDIYHVDVDSIKKHNGLVYYWMLVDYLEPIHSVANSIISKWKVDCVEEKETFMNSTWYSQSMGKGKIIYEDTPNKIEYPNPNTVDYIVMKFACNNAR